MEEEEELYPGKSFVDAAKAIKSGITYFTKNSVEKRKLQDQYENVVPSFSLKAPGGTEGAVEVNSDAPRVQRISGVSDLLAVKTGDYDALSTPFKLTSDTNFDKVDKKKSDGFANRLISSNNQLNSSRKLSSMILNPGGGLNISGLNFPLKTGKSPKQTDDSISTSRKRGGLFGNFGKEVEIKKTFNKETGKINRQKFVNGELAKDRSKNQELRGAKREFNSKKRKTRRTDRRDNK